MLDSMARISSALSMATLLYLVAGCTPSERDEYVVDSLAVVEAVNLARSITPQVLVDPSPLVPDPDWTAALATDYVVRNDLIRMRELLLTELEVGTTALSTIAPCDSVPGYAACPTGREGRVGVALSRVQDGGPSGVENKTRVVRVLIQDVDPTSRSTLVYDLDFARDTRGKWSFQGSRLIGAID